MGEGRRVKNARFWQWGYSWGYKVGLHFSKSGVTHLGIFDTISLGGRTYHFKGIGWGKLPICDIGFCVQIM